MIDYLEIQKQAEKEIARKLSVTKEGVQRVADVMDELGPIMGWDEMYDWYDEAVPDDAEWPEMLEIVNAKKKELTK